MKIGFITNLRAPYRTVQFNRFSEIDGLKINIYYTNKLKDNRVWETNKVNGFSEIDLKGIKVSEKNGYLNSGLFKIIKENDFLILGGYEQPTLLALAILCKITKKPYAVSFDGISTNRINDVNSGIKSKIKTFIVNNSSAVLANGTVGKLYFENVFNYPSDKIFNQYLTIDTNKIEELYKQKDIYREYYRKQLNIEENKKVLIFSGRLIEIKNVESVVKALSQIKRKDIVFVILGGGVLESSIVNLAKELNVDIRITGFIKSQEELFKNYFAGDALILPSKNEPWGLVINEALSIGLPVIVSNICGCSLDLVEDGINGFIIDPNDINSIAKGINAIFEDNKYSLYSKKSLEISKKWTFDESKAELEKLLSFIAK